MLFAFQTDQKRIRRRRQWAGHIGSIGSERRKVLLFSYYYMIVVCLMETTNIYRRETRERKRKWRYNTLINSCQASSIGVKEESENPSRLLYTFSSGEAQDRRLKFPNKRGRSFKRRVHAYVQNKTMTLASFQIVSVLWNYTTKKKKDAQCIYCTMYEYVAGTPLILN